MQSPSPRVKVALAIVLALSMSACATPKASTPDKEADMPCPEWTSGQLGLTVSVAPISVPHILSSEGAVPDYGTQARRISIAVKPPEAGSRVRLSESSLSIYIFGGIFRGWVLPANELKDAAKDSAAIAPSRIVSSSQALELLPGRVMVTPFLKGRQLHAQTQSIDVAILPGGMTVDQLVVMMPSLWGKDERPIAPAVLDVELSPLRLSSVYKTVEASINLDYHISNATGSERFSCTATRHVILVDPDAIRPSLWDVGVASKFGTRKKWLALYSPSTGAVRAIFTTLEAAHAFTKWVQQSGAVTAGKYSIGLFTPTAPTEEDPNLPADTTIMQTYQPISAEELLDLRAGEIGKP
jgi:hypothetical protein